MKASRVAVVSFPGNNCEVESLRAIKNAGMEAVYFRWNDDHAKLKDIDGYFIPGGFSYEDRGRSGMVAARDPLMKFLSDEAAKGKTIIGNCNGAQTLVESGLIPLDRGLHMSLARNAIEENGTWTGVGFLNEWVWIKPSDRSRCATSDWNGVMHLPIAHGEGRFTTRDPDLIKELKKNKQIAFEYCDENGNVSTDPIVTPNGSMFAIAGICNPAGNVVALMPHPERTPNGAPYFAALKRWIEKGKKPSSPGSTYEWKWEVPGREAKDVEIFIDTIITNNEEHTVEQAAHRIAPKLSLKQWKYITLGSGSHESVLKQLGHFNPNKERAYVRLKGTLHRWNNEAKKIEPLTEDQVQELFSGISLLRRDIPDTGAPAFGKGSETGICYTCRNVTEKDLKKSALLEVFANPHASTLERMSDL
ncbi:phosphoribosylformylglycinamidine synthase I [Candidatus Peregrinibacteria bacterium]|nr:phosphoribosylformylglycinamidine synthase I [Candidatus Peregrinibacteria bacterium]